MNRKKSIVSHAASISAWCAVFDWFSIVEATNVERHGPESSSAARRKTATRSYQGVAAQLACASRAASIAFHWMRNGAGVALISDEWESSADRAQTTLDEILEYLALVEMSPTAPTPNFEPQAGALVLSLRHERDSK